VRLRTDKHRERLFLGEEEFFGEDGEVFDLPASMVATLRLSGIPLGIRVRLCDRVIGSRRDLYGRHPDVIFEKSRKHGLVAHLSSVILPPSEECFGNSLDEFFAKSLEFGERSLDPLHSAQRLVGSERSIFDDSSFLNVTLKLFDKSFVEAEAFMSEIDRRITGAYTPPNLFVCHASEDKPFIDRLVSDLDRRAMFAWYDKREIFCWRQYR